MWAVLTLALTGLAVVLVIVVWRQRELRARRTWLDEEARRSAAAWREENPGPGDFPRDPGDPVAPGDPGGHEGAGEAAATGQDESPSG